MKAKKVLFRRYLIINASTVFISIFILSTMLLYIVRETWSFEKKVLLTNNANMIADFIIENSKLQEQIISFEKKDLDNFNLIIKTVSNSINADIIVTNTVGDIIISSNNFNSTAVNSKIVEKTFKGNYFDRSDLGGFFIEEHYTVGIPLSITNYDGTSANIGAVFCSISGKNHTSFLANILLCFLIAFAVCFVILLIISSLFSYSLVKPLQQMSNATEAYSRGDFSARVTVNSNDEIGQLANAFNNMATSLENLETANNNFISNVSHELKTPMTTISGFIDGILDGTIKPENQRKYLSIVSAEVKRLSRLVQSMLSISKIYSGEMQLKYSSFDLSEILINIFFNFEMKIKEKNLEIIGLDKLTHNIIEADRDMIYQVLYNLIENAAKFTNENGYIQATVDYNAEFNLYTIKIKNSGEGIDSKDLLHIFDKFYKADKSRSLDKNGMGLGLYIVKTIIQMHKGQINVKSEVNKYCEFIIDIPKNKQ